MNESVDASEVPFAIINEVEKAMLIWYGGRNGYGEEEFDRPQGKEFYKGNFTNDAYHGFGYYKNDSIFNEKWAYEGSFFSNSKEGYGRLSLAGNSFFEGLFKNDQPFGPGVLTMASGDQNVGFWRGSSLVRLTQLVDSDVKSLSSTAGSKIDVLRFRKLVNINPAENIALEIATRNNLSQEDSSQLHSIYSKNPRSKLFNREVFERNFFEDLRPFFELCTPTSDYSEEAMKIDPPAEDDGKDSRIRESNETEEQSLAWDRICNEENLILSWNNSPIIVDMMIHTFRHHLFENLAGFSVIHLLCNDRKHFKKRGPQEQASVDLLKSSSSGDLKGLTRILAAYNNLNVNVQDNKGNGCVIRAASRDDHSLLYLLFIFGADFNMSNDEGFTPLNHTLTRYLAIKNRIENWGTGFLHPISNNPQNRQSNEKTIGSGGHYVFDLNPAERPLKKSAMSKVPSIGAKKRSKQKLSRLTQDSDAAAADQTEQCSNLKLQKTYETLKLLLSLKVDPNASIAPQPSIIQAVFSEDFALVKMLLEAGADPNARFLPEEGSLTALHVLCLAKPHESFPDIMDILLEYGANPNSQSSANYDTKTQRFLLNSKFDDGFPVGGIRPLEALLLRIDAPYVHRHEILKELLLKLHDLTDKDPKYYGHSFLSMAVARANLGFIFTLLHVFGADPNEELDTRLGNICTVCLTYLGATKDYEAIIAILELEVAGMNPLRLVKTNQTAEEENAIDYAFAMLPVKKSKQTSKKHGTTSPSKDVKRSSKSPARKSRVESLTRNASLGKSAARKSNASKKGRKKSRTGSKASNASLRKSMARKSSVSKGRQTDSRRDVKKANKDAKELSVKVTLLQDMGREKVEKYVRGHVLRRLLRHLRESEHHGQPIDTDDARVRNLIDWFPTEDEFARVLTLNVRAGIAFLSREDVVTIYKMMRWPEPGSPSLDKKMTAQGDLLSTADKVLLDQLKNIIKGQLHAGIDIEKIEIPIMKKKTGSAASRQRSRKSKKSTITSDDDTKRQGGSVATSLHPTGIDHTNMQHSASNPSSNAREEEFLLKLTALISVCAPHVRWAKRYGIKTVKMTKQEVYNTDLYPEVDKIAHLYKVCYKCIRRASKLELCPMCKLLSYCSSECNIQDILNLESNHRCRADFFNRGDKWRQYGIDQFGNVYRIPRAGQEGWESADILEDGLVKKHGSHKNGSGSRTETRRKGQIADAESRLQRSEHHSKRSGESKRQSLRKHSRRDEPTRHEPTRHEPTRHESRADSELGRSGQFSRRSIDSVKGRGNRKRGRGSGQLGTASRKRKGKSVTLVGIDKKPILDNKKMLRLQEVARMRQLRQKLPKGIMGDFLRWGQTKKQTLQTVPWYRMVQQDQGPNASNARTLLARQTQILHDLSQILGPNFDLSTWFPWIVVRNGELYYKINSTLFGLENYSLN
ncbi:Ankyrin repeat and MYND domain containing 1 [Nesidiocoris tenuis]|uniref:Ankyrin repeat and MYND domain containing 1 n=1 Tax=Nesidiocoris tenuis TaxID=355587 RepID=A0ABN7AKG8_9HEMI|nr:Ankyrin repeat and MYND domain containing 1 [Nesidiocoris tenuis]